MSMRLVSIAFRSIPPGTNPSTAQSDNNSILIQTESLLVLSLLQSNCQCTSWISTLSSSLFTDDFLCGLTPFSYPRKFYVASKKCWNLSFQNMHRTTYLYYRSTHQHAVRTPEISPVFWKKRKAQQIWGRSKQWFPHCPYLLLTWSQVETERTTFSPLISSQNSRLLLCLPGNWHIANDLANELQPFANWKQWLRNIKCCVWSSLLSTALRETDLGHLASSGARDPTARAHRVLFLLTTGSCTYLPLELLFATSLLLISWPF